MGARRRRAIKTGFTAFAARRGPGPAHLDSCRRSPHQSEVNNQQMVLPDAVVQAARAGNVATVEQWLDAGGDANERCATSGESLLNIIAADMLRSDGEERARCDIARLVLARGAERSVRSARVGSSRSRGANFRDAEEIYGAGGLFCAAPLARGGEAPGVAGPARPGCAPCVHVLAGPTPAPGKRFLLTK